jgi:hypothetical protein
VWISVREPGTSKGNTAIDEARFLLPRRLLRHFFRVSRSRPISLGLRMPLRELYSGSYESHELGSVDPPPTPLGHG